MSTYPSVNEIISPTKVTWGLEHNNFVFTSITNISQAVIHPASVWKGQMAFELVDEEERADVEIFFDTLDGRAGRFKVFNPSYKTYPALGEPVVGRASQTGRTVYTTGWLPNRRVLRKGQFFNINHELKRCTENVFSDEHGVCTIPFYPRIRVIPAVGTALEVQKPYILATRDDSYVPTETDEDLNSAISIAFTEAVYERI